MGSKDLSVTKEKNASQDFADQLAADVERVRSDSIRKVDLNYKRPIKTSKEARLAVEADYGSPFSKYVPQHILKETTPQLSPLIKDLVKFGTKHREEVIKELKSSADCSSASANAIRSWFVRLRMEWLLTPPCLPEEAAGLVWTAFYLTTPIPNLTKEFIVGFLKFYKLPLEGPFFDGQPPIYSMPFSIAQHFEKAMTTDVHAALDAAASNAAEEEKEEEVEEALQKKKKKSKKLNR